VGVRTDLRDDQGADREASVSAPDKAPTRAAGICARCDRYTKNATVRWVTRNSGPDARVILHADPEECSRRRT
jgi:hypothetical protein